MKGLITLATAVLFLTGKANGTNLSGTLLCPFLDVSSSFAGTTNWFDAFVEKGEFVIRCGAVDDPRVDYFEYGSYEGKSSYQLIVYKPNPDRPFQDHRMTLTLYPTWQPESSMGFYIPIWFLTAGGTYFRTSGSGEITIIGEVPNRVFDLNKKTKAKWAIADGYIGEFVEFFNGEFYQNGDEDNLIVEPAPQLAGATNITYSVLARTNYNGVSVPVRFVYNS